MSLPFDFANAKPKRKSPRGISTNDLVFSAKVGGNAELFPEILSLYVNKGSRIADTTFGRGVFWKHIPLEKYNILPTDIASGIDARSLPYRDGELDAVIFDPPYMSGNGKSVHSDHQNFESYYRNSARYQAEAALGGKKKYHDAVLDLYFSAAREALRVLRRNGIYIVKCQDEVCAGKQRLTHVELITFCAGLGFIAEDIFVLVRNGRPGVSRMLRQRHARKNHSYFLVFKKKA